MKDKSIKVTQDNNVFLLKAEGFIGETNQLTEMMPVASLAGKAYLASKKSMQSVTIVSPYSLVKTNYEKYLEFDVKGCSYLIPADKWSTSNEKEGAISIEVLLTQVFS